MDFELSHEVKIVKRTAREFAEQVIAPLVDTMESTNQLPEQLIGAMGEVGLLGLIAPQEYGGSNQGYVARTAALEEISRVSPAVALCLQVHHMEVAALVDWGSEEQKQRFLPPLTRGDYLGAVAVTEPTGGSDLMGMTTTATRKGNGYLLNGRKCFITNCHLAGAPLIIAKTGQGSRGLSAFVVEKDCPGYSPGRHDDKLGLRGSDTGEMFLRDCLVPASNLVADEGAGIKVGLDTIGEVGRPGMAGVALGIIEASYQEAVKFAKERVLFGKPIAKLQAIQWAIAEILADLEASRLLCYHSSWLKDQERPCAVKMTLAKVYATEAAVRASRKSLEVHGACGTMTEYPISRLYRDAMVCISAGGTTEVGKLVLSRHALS